ncbi:MAG: hypothetical protein ACRDHF_12285 [Tepidiformaceae bacterium]
MVKPRCRGEAGLIRDADEVVCALQNQVDAERFDQAWGQRRSKFGLAVSAAKTRGIPCSRPQAPGHPSVDLLGVELRWGQDRPSTPPLKRRPSRQKRRNALTRVTDWGQEQGRSRRKDVFGELNAQRRGYDNDDGVNGNSASRRACFTGARRLRFRWLHRRRQRRRDPWAGGRPRLHHCRVERPRLVGRPPMRLAAGRA